MREHQTGDQKRTKNFHGVPGVAWISHATDDRPGSPNADARKTRDFGQVVTKSCSACVTQSGRMRRATRRPNVFTHAPCKCAVGARMAQ
jgi:hypothetical protein